MHDEAARISQEIDPQSPPALLAAAFPPRAKGGNMLIDPATTSNEHYTPIEYAGAARGVLGGINLDPASCFEANSVVRATMYHGSPPPADGDSRRPSLHAWSGYTDGLERARSIGWHGTVFLNPPGGYMLEEVDGKEKRVSCVPRWWRALVRQWEAGNVTQAIFLAFNMNVFRTAQSFGDVMPPHVFPFCVPRDRICFDRLDENGNRVPGKQPPQDSAIIYLPPVGLTARDLGVRRFKEVFSAFGECRV